MLLGTPQETAIVNKDKYNFAVAGWEIRGYDRPYDPTAPDRTPDEFIKNTQRFDYNSSAPPIDARSIGSITTSGGETYPVYIGGGHFYIDHGQDAVCGDGVCNGDENCGSCLGDCPCAGACISGVCQPQAGLHAKIVCLNCVDFNKIYLV